MNSEEPSGEPGGTCQTPQDMNSGEHFEATWGNLPDLAGHELKGTFTGTWAGTCHTPQDMNLGEPSGRLGGTCKTLCKHELGDPSEEARKIDETPQDMNSEAPSGGWGNLLDSAGHELRGSLQGKLGKPARLCGT